jgi:uncharacterized protein YndB with AHSA1/START domain
MTHSTLSAAEAREYVFSTARTLEALPEQVFDTFLRPGRLARWWGPAGFSNDFHHFDFREGGDWTFTMIGPDGTHYPNRSRFLEIVPGCRIQIEHLSGPHFVLEITLAPVGRRTRLDWRQHFQSQTDYDAVKAFVPAANEQNLDRLAAELASGSAAR